MNLAIDIGNTSVKAAWFELNQLVELQSEISFPELLSRIPPNLPGKVIISSVASPSDHVQQLSKIVPTDCHLVVLDDTTPLPFQNNYRTPASLGTDRIAAVAGAQTRFPNQDVLVIDAGTCVTYDLLTAQGEYLGGMISPGLRLRWRAMHTFTARLPLVSVESSEESKNLAIMNQSTEESLKSGGLVGMAAEIDQIIRRYADKFAALRVVSCGGDIDYLQPWIQTEHTHIPELVLIGLNSIVQYEG